MDLRIRCVYEWCVRVVRWTLAANSSVWREDLQALLLGDVVFGSYVKDMTYTSFCFPTLTFAQHLSYSVPSLHLHNAARDFFFVYQLAKRHPPPRISQEGAACHKS